MFLGTKVSTNGPMKLDANRKFFCSELVAKAYKYAGVMGPTDESSSNFKPVNFSAGNDKRLKLVDGARLSREILIVVNN